jgi:hypothetical protein
MIGVAALVAILIDLLKRFGLVQDGDAPKWSAALNLIALIALVAMRYIAPQFSVEFLDEQAGAVAQIAVVILSFVVQLRVSPAVHDAGVMDRSVLAFSHNSDRFDGE